MMSLKTSPPLRGGARARQRLAGITDTAAITLLSLNRSQLGVPGGGSGSSDQTKRVDGPRHTYEVVEHTLRQAHRSIQRLSHTEVSLYVDGYAGIPRFSDSRSGEARILTHSQNPSRFSDSPVPDNSDSPGSVRDGNNTDVSYPHLWTRLWITQAAGS